MKCFYRSLGPLLSDGLQYSNRKICGYENPWLAELFITHQPHVRMLMHTLDFH